MKIRFKFCLLLIIISPSVQLLGQKALQLTNLNGGRKLLIQENNRVQCITNDSRYIGTLSSITDSAIVVNGNPVLLNAIQSIGRKRRGAGFFSFAEGWIAGAMLADAIFSSPNSGPSCPNCQTTSQDNTGGPVLEALAGFGVLVLAINTAGRNSPKKLSNWKLKVVDQPETLTSK